MQAQVVITGTVQPRRCPVRVGVYELRLFPPGGSPYRRGTNRPLTVATTTSSRGRPKWMMRAAQLISARDASPAEVPAILQEAARQVRSEAARRRR